MTGLARPFSEYIPISDYDLKHANLLTLGHRRYHAPALYIFTPRLKKVRQYLSWVINIIHLMLKCSHIQFQYVFFPVRSCQLRDTLVVVH